MRLRRGNDLQLAYLPAAPHYSRRPVLDSTVSVTTAFDFLGKPRLLRLLASRVFADLTAVCGHRLLGGSGYGGSSKKAAKTVTSDQLERESQLACFLDLSIFVADNAIGFVNLLGAEIDPVALYIILPLGISFYTFQTISYTVDVYRGFIKPERDFVLYACYAIFFPQLVAGPVLRAAEVIHQFANRVQFKWDDVFTGARRVLYGLFLKVVLADNIAPIVDKGFETPLLAMSALDVWTLAFLFGFQVYFDFSAYSHIAIGSARMMGIRFPENFNFPYLAISPKDFWRRWHTSRYRVGYGTLIFAVGRRQGPRSIGRRFGYGDDRPTPYQGAVLELGHHGALARGELDVSYLGAVPRGHDLDLSRGRACHPGFFALA